MKDDKGLYYHPFPQNKKVRMYVQATGNDVLFRMWNADDPRMWEDHGWVPYTAVTRAAKMYDNKNFDPYTVLPRAVLPSLSFVACFLSFFVPPSSFF